MTYNFPYLKNSAFLKSFDNIRLKEQYVKIIVLDFKENPLQEIQGKITGGSISLDGNSAMRRTGNISFIADDYENDLTTTRNLLSINKKIEVLIGFKNITQEYTDFNMLWFPQGVFVITAPNITHNSSGINISLTLHDKMALLNGECGGSFPASIVFHERESTDEEGNLIIVRPTIFQIIQQLVHHFGGEQLGKILISDIDNKIKKVMKWTGITPLYLYRQVEQNGKIYHSLSTNYEELAEKQAVGQGQISEFDYGEDIGYILTDFVYPNDLIGNAGDSVVTILDQIKNFLGNYEYFYDINGNFRFQQIKNFLNTSYSTLEINKINMGDYLTDYTNEKSVYTFEDAEIVLSYSNSPQFQQIKNDFIVWGKRKTIDNKEVPIRYHLAIDKKPETGNTYKIFFFVDPNDKIEKAKKPLAFENRDVFPEKGESEMFYLAEDTDIIYKWDGKTREYEQTSYTIQSITTTDYRSELYLQGVEQEPFGLDGNYYYTELKNEWPKIYNLRRGEFKQETLSQPSDIDFFLDFIDSSDAISELGVTNIGRRTAAIVDDSINCLFEPDSPNLVIIETNSQDIDQLVEECENKNQEYVQVRPQIYSLLLEGGLLKSAYEQIRKELYQYTNYNEQVSISTLPIYYLQPNTRITLRDPKSGIYGDYVINTISLPFDSAGVMNISCTKAFERI